MSDSAQQPTDAIAGFDQPGCDRVRRTARDAVAAAVPVAGVDTKVTLSDGSTILLKGVVRVDGSFLR